MSKWRNRDLATRDMRKLKQLRKPRDRRLRPETEEGRLARIANIRQIQMDLALHRQGLVSPFDYEYPRLKKMSKLAQYLFNKYVVPHHNAWCVASGLAEIERASPHDSD